MAISVKCPKCNAALRVPDEAPGKKVRCAGCQEVFLVPKPQAAPSPAPPAPQTTKAAPTPTAAGAIRKACEYRTAEKIVLTLPLRGSGGEIPAGTPGVVVERPTNPNEDWLRLGFEGYEYVGEALKTLAYKVESLAHGSGDRFLARNNRGNFPLRRCEQGWYLPEGGTPVVHAKLRDGRSITGAVYARTNAPGSFSLATKLHIGRRYSDETGATSWKGAEFAADDIEEMVWLSKEPIPEELPEIEPAKEPWTRFAKHVKIAKGLHETAVRPNMRFQFLFKDKDDADRVLGQLPSELLGALRRGECWMRSVNAQGKYQLAWNNVEMSVAQGKDLLNRVVSAGGEIYEAILE